MKWTAPDRCGFICYVAVIHHSLPAGACGEKLWRIAAGEIRFLPWHRVDLSLRGSREGPADRLSQGSLVVQDHPASTEIVFFVIMIIIVHKVAGNKLKY